MVDGLVEGREGVVLVTVIKEAVRTGGRWGAFRGRGGGERVSVGSSSSSSAPMSNNMPSPPFSKSRTYPSLPFAFQYAIRAKGDVACPFGLCPPQRWGFSICIPCTAAVLPVVIAAPTALGTMVTGSKRTSVNEARTVRLTWAGLCDPRKRAVSALGGVPVATLCSDSYQKSTLTREQKVVGVSLLVSPMIDTSSRNCA